MKLRTKIILLSGLMLITATLLFGIVTFKSNEKALLDGIDAKLLATATLAKEILPADYHDKITGTDSVSEAEYKQIVERWTRLCRQMGLEYIWSLMRIEGKIVFTSATPKSKDVSKGDYARFFEKHGTPELYTAAFESMKPRYQINDNMWGRTRVVLLPFQDSHGRPFLFGASMKTTEVDALLRKTIWQTLGISAGILLFSVLLSVFFSVSLVRPLEKLKDLAGSITKGNWGDVIEPSGATEIRSLAHSVNEMSRSIQEKITERRVAEDGLARVAREWQNTFDATNDAIWILNKDHQILRSNKVAESMFHHPVEEIVGKHCWEIVHGTTQPIPECPISLVQKSLRRETMELPMGDRWFEVNVDPILDATGQYFGAVHIVSDITERKKVEEAFHEREEKYRHLFNNAEVGIFRTRLDGSEVLEVNKRFLEIVGMTLEETVGKPSVNLWADQKEREEMVKILVANGSVSQFEYRMLNKLRGDVRNCLTSLRLYREQGILEGSILDITERKQAEEEKKKLQDQLIQSQKMESVGRLAGGVAHDFNNMLGLILGYSEIALDKAASDHSLLADLTEIRKAAIRSADLTGQLLAFARQQTIAPRVIDLNEAVENTLKMLQRLIGEDIDLDWQPEADLWPVKIDPSQIDQILANLCVNARDAIAGVGKLTIETKNISFDEAYCADHADFVPGEYVSLMVSDDGCGMNKETAGKIFEPFFTTKGVGKGTGLGLATIYGIVKQNNGFINVYSEQNQGSTFRIYLPRQTGEVEQRRTEEPHQINLRGNETILLVEDEPSLLDLNKLVLESNGYQVLIAGTPGEAIRLAGEHTGKIDLLMTDVVMPEMNGQELAKRLSALTPDLKCLFTSGYTANVIAHHGVLEEGVQFIQKPFSRKDLAAKVREALDQA